MASGVGFDLPPVRPIFEKYISEKGLAERRDSQRRVRSRRAQSLFYGRILTGPPGTIFQISR
jgi:hypothetical protein